MISQNKSLRHNLIYFISNDVSFYIDLILNIFNHVINFKHSNTKMSFWTGVKVHLEQSIQEWTN